MPKWWQLVTLKNYEEVLAGYTQHCFFLCHQLELQIKYKKRLSVFRFQYTSFQNSEMLKAPIISMKTVHCLNKCVHAELTYSRAANRHDQNTAAIKQNPPSKNNGKNLLWGFFLQYRHNNKKQQRSESAFHNRLAGNLKQWSRPIMCTTPLAYNFIDDVTLLLYHHTPTMNAIQDYFTLEQ